ncbi:MAG: hypothetical protein ACOZAA_14090 [Pseudomonadota bacterium]
MEKTAEPVAAAASAEVAEPAAEAAAEPDAKPAEDPWPEGFPKPSADYAGVYEFAAAAGNTMEVAINASGPNQRLAFPPGAGVGGAKREWSQIIVNKNAGAAMLMWPEGEGAPKIATTMAKSDLGAVAGAFGVDEATQARAKRTGTDKIAGESCAIWEIAGEDGAAPANACVTRDGILLRAVSGEQTVMLAKSIERGAQDPALFAPPEGYEVVDMGECMRLSAEMMEAMRAGKQPDMAKMEKCRALGEKMGAMYGNE